jgi:hypothetical protein
MKMNNENEENNSKRPKKVEIQKIEWTEAKRSVTDRLKTTD